MRHHSALRNSPIRGSLPDCDTVRCGPQHCRGVQLLLYGEERAQADSFIADGTLPSAVYGAEHLLRLFVKLPEYLPIAGSTEEQYRVLQTRMHEVLDFLQSKATEYFVPPSEYVVPMQE